MRTEDTTRSVDKLQDALGLIEDQYIEEAHEIACAETHGESQEAAFKETQEEPEKTSVLKWKKRTRIAGIIVAAACVVLIVGAVILLPKRAPSEQSAAEATTVPETMAAEEYADEAAAEEAAVYEAAAEETAAYNAATGNVEISDEEAGEVPAGAADGIMEFEAKNEMNMSGTTALDAGGFGQAVAISLTAKDDGTVPLEEQFVSGKGLLIRSAEQLDEFINDSGFMPEGDEKAAEQWKSELTERYDSDFFKDRNLAISYVELASGAYEMTYLFTSEDAGKAEQHYTVYRADQDPEKAGAVVTADMASWLIISEVAADITEVTAVEDPYPYE